MIQEKHTQDQAKHDNKCNTEEKKHAGKKESSRIKELNCKIDELNDSLLRLQAEFDNYKKRSDKDKQDIIKCASYSLIEKLLPILDSFELALSSNKNNDSFSEGMKLIFSQLYSTLEKEGLRQINPLGQRFDPYKHEVLMHEKSGKENNTITEVLQKGYMVNDRIIRHAKVKISKNC